MDKQYPQQQWQQAVIAYAQAVNDYVAQGRAQGWDNLQAPQVPATDHLLDAWLAALQAANRPDCSEQQRQAFRQAWPPAHQPLVPLLDEHGQGISNVLLLTTVACWRASACRTKKARCCVSIAMGSPR